MNDTIPTYTLVRKASTANSTMGEMFNPDGSHLCFTCELPWLNNQPEKSCVPAASYTCIPHDSPAHPDTWELENVPGRTNILIHNGNFFFQLLGCIAVGSSIGPLEYIGSEYPAYNGQTFIAALNSVNTLDMLRDNLSSTFSLGISWAGD
jgi:hypothetical protein